MPTESQNILIKQCFACGQLKRLSAFYTHPGMRDGHLNKCKECCKRYVKDARRDPIVGARVRQYDTTDRKLRPEYRQQRAQQRKRYQQRYPERYQARTAVRNALRSGRLTKQPCVICGSSTNLEAHHEDYAKPLEVIWLCRQHHFIIARA